MTCCGFGDTADQHFNSEKVEQELRKYRRRGPGVTTRKLRDGLVAAGVTRGTVLDVGGGLGALSLALLDTGMNRASVVDASCLQSWRLLSSRSFTPFASWSDRAPRCT
jgi:2-polyprenyl-3-methyl-5-hydroxy-6-metoxy-1,4-benzoquinol methylase